MIPVTFSELRHHAKKYFDAVEKGQALEVYRHGKPIAIVSPRVKSSGQRWKSARPIRINKVSLSQAILEERRED